MRKVWFVLTCLAVIFCFGTVRGTTLVYLYVDTAPNIFGSPDWSPWWSNAKSSVVGGSFVNMQNGPVPGKLLMRPTDEIVYSTMDLGKRLHWIYWIPGRTVPSMVGLFQVKWVVDWDDTYYTYDWNTYSLIYDEPDKGWVQPSKWEEYSGGVIGTFGFAWWADDDLAPSYDTDGNPYNETDMADVMALSSLVFQYQTFATGWVRWRESLTSDWQYASLRVNIIPEPSTILLLGSGLFSFGFYGFFRRRKF